MYISSFDIFNNFGDFLMCYLVTLFDLSFSDTWGLNFTSPIDAKQFRECCDFSKSSARYLYKNGLRLGSKSSPASPTKQEPQCTCTTMHLSEKQKQLRMQSSRGKKVNFFRIFASKINFTQLMPILALLVNLWLFSEIWYIWLTWCD